MQEDRRLRGRLDLAPPIRDALLGGGVNRNRSVPLPSQVVPPQAATMGPPVDVTARRRWNDGMTLSTVIVAVLAWAAVDYGRRTSGTKGAMDAGRPTVAVSGEVGGW